MGYCHFWYVCLSTSSVLTNHWSITYFSDQCVCHQCHHHSFSPQDFSSYHRRWGFTRQAPPRAIHHGCCSPWIEANRLYRLWGCPIRSESRSCEWRTSGCGLHQSQKVSFGGIRCAFDRWEPFRVSIHAFSFVHELTEHLASILTLKGTRLLSYFPTNYHHTYIKFI